jgi:hypothetical protein
MMANKAHSILLEASILLLSGDGYYLDRFIDEGSYKYKCFVPPYKHHGIPVYLLKCMLTKAISKRLDKLVKPFARS